MKLIQPNYLKAGDTIAILAPAGILKNKQDIINDAKKLAESWGLKVILVIGFSLIYASKIIIMNTRCASA